MSRVDFYILKNPQANLYLFACRLIEKAYKMNHRIYVHCETPDIAKKLDALLWTFDDISFVPHSLEKIGDFPVVIGSSNPDVAFKDILINLNPQSANNTNFARVIEIVSSHEPALSQSRMKYAEYQKRGCDLKTHEISE